MEALDMKKFFLIFVFLIGCIFAEEFTTYYSSVYTEGGNLPDSRHATTDFNFSTSADAYFDQQGTIVFLPKNFDILKPLSSSETYYVCPTKITFTLSTSGSYNITKFDANEIHFDKNICKCGTGFQDCDGCARYESGEENNLPPFNISFISDKLNIDLSSYADRSAEIDGPEWPRRYLGDRWEEVSGWMNGSKIGSYKKPKKIKVKTDVDIWNDFLSYTDLFLAGNHFIDITKDRSTIFQQVPHTWQNSNISSRLQDTYTYQLVNSKGTKINIGGYNYQVSDYSFYPTFKFSNLYLLFFNPPISPPPITFNGQDYYYTRAIYYQRDISFSGTDFSSKPLRIYVVEPDSCSDINIIPGSLSNIKINQEQQITFYVNHNYELFDMNATDIKITNPSNWKVKPIRGFNESIEAGSIHELAVNITPTSMISAKTQVCFNITFETVVPFCDGKKCNTTKQICLDYDPTFNCSLVLPRGEDNRLIEGESIIISANCTLDNNPYPCPNLSWVALGFRPDDSAKLKSRNNVARVSIVNITGLSPSAMIAIPKPQPFYPGGTSPSSSSPPNRSLDSYRVSLPRTQGIKLFTYSKQENKTWPSGNSDGIVYAKGLTDDGKEFKCDPVHLYVFSQILPDLAPILSVQSKPQGSSGKIDLVVKWGVENKVDKEPYLKSGDSTLSSPAVPDLGDFIEIGADIINKPFNIRLSRWINGKWQPLESRTVNSLMKGEKFYGTEFSVQCSDKIVDWFRVEVDVGNSILERNENNNIQTDVGFCVMKFVCPDYV
jgi:hypothetical protein